MSEELRVKITPIKQNGKWCPQLTIGNQHFILDHCESKKVAEWACEMLEKALNKLVISTAREAVEQEKNEWGEYDMDALRALDDLLIRIESKLEES